MDVFKYTQCILPFLFRDSLTCIDGISGRFDFKDIQWFSTLHARSLFKVRVSLSTIKLEKKRVEQNCFVWPLVLYSDVWCLDIFFFSPESNKTILFHSFFSSLMELKDTRTLRRDLANQAWSVEILLMKSELLNSKRPEIPCTWVCRGIKTAKCIVCFEIHPSTKYGLSCPHCTQKCAVGSTLLPQFEQNMIHETTRNSAFWLDSHGTLRANVTWAR